MEFLKIAALVLIAVILLSCLPGIDKSISSVIYISVSILVLLYIVKNISEAIENIKTITDRYVIKDFTVIFKAMGISIITQFVSDIAVDTGNKTLANRMIFTGKIAITIISLPVMLQVLEMIGKLAG